MLVAMVGGSGAGKTSVAREVYKHFGDRAAILSMDDYYINMEPGIDPRTFNFDSPKAFDFDLMMKHLAALKEGNPVQVPVYNMVTYRREDGISKSFSPKPLLIVEGILILYKKELRSLFDFSVYIDAPADERLMRRIERDTKERGRSVDSIIRQYREFVAPSFENFIEPQKYFCDIVLPDGVQNKTGLSIIKNAIENMLKA